MADWLWVRLRKQPTWAEIGGTAVADVLGSLLAIVFALVMALVRGTRALVRILYPASRRERVETRRLYRQVTKAYAATPLSTTDPFEVVKKVVGEAYARLETDLPVSVIEQCLALVEALLLKEGFAPPPTINWSAPLSAEEGVALRTHLRRQKHLFEQYDRYLEIWQRKVIAIIVGVIGSVPARALSESNENGEEAVLSVAMVDLLERPAEIIERLIGTLVDDEVVDTPLFESLRRQTELNLFAASGIPPEKIGTTEKTLLFPTKARGKSPRELAEAYLAGTPFADFLSVRLPFAIPFPTRFEHTHIVGGTGHGKTQLMQFLIHQDLRKAREGKGSVIVIDGQGDLIRTIARLACFSPTADASLAERLLIIDPTDIEYPLCLNMFDVKRERLARYRALDRERILNGTVELYKYIFGALLGAELTQKQGVIFGFLARLMLTIPGATIHTLRELMEEGERFRHHMDALDGSARTFFATQFFDRSFDDTKKQILRRLWGVLENATFERMFAHPSNKVDLFEAMNAGKIVLINTAKDLLKAEWSRIFGRFFIAMIAQAALERQVIEGGRRRSTFVYLDEAHEYVDDNIEDLLNQARKYRVGMVMAHQNLDQLSDRERASFMASTSIKFAGGVSAKDARAFANEMRCAPEFVLDAHKREARQETEFACFVKNTTPQAVRITVPLGLVERLPRTSDEEYDLLIERNRARYCGSREETRENVVRFPASKGGFALGQHEVL